MRGVVFEEAANDLADASTLQRRTLDRAPMEVLRDSDRDAWRVRSNCGAQRWATRTRLPGGQVEPVFDPLGQTVDVGSSQFSAGLRLQCPWHRITLSESARYFGRNFMAWMTRSPSLASSRPITSSGIPSWSGPRNTMRSASSGSGEWGGQWQCSTTYRARWCSIECRVADRLNRIAIPSRYYVRHNLDVNGPGRAAIIASGLRAGSPP